MPHELRSEILVPGRSHVLTALAAIGCGALGAVLGYAARPAATHDFDEFVPVTVLAVQEPARIEPMTLPAASPQVLRSTELSLVFSAAGTTYVKLTDIGEDAEVMPKFGRAKLVDDDGVTTAFAMVEARDVPKAYRRWAGREVIVDGSCRANVTGFAVVSRLTGDTGYAGIDDDKWTAKNVLEHGSVVLAAKLDGCKGTFARGAELPPVIIPREIEDAELAAKARAALIASGPAQQTQRDYLEFDTAKPWYDSDYVSFATRIVRHPTTGVTWVSVHGSMDHGCGGPDVNVWGLYRVEADGTLAAAQLRHLGDLHSIEKLIDIDNDGELELIGHPWLGLDTVLVRGSGEELDRLPLAFFGCPC
jgi:hypothetical protein